MPGSAANSSYHVLVGPARCASQEVCMMHAYIQRDVHMMMHTMRKLSFKLCGLKIHSASGSANSCWDCSLSSTTGFVVFFPKEESVAKDKIGAAWKHNVLHHVYLWTHVPETVAKPFCQSRCCTKSFLRVSPRRKSYQLRSIK